MGNIDRAREHFTRYQQMETNPDAQAEAEIHRKTLEAKNDKYGEVASRDQTRTLEKEWAAYRKQHRLDVEGKALAEVAESCRH